MNDWPEWIPASRRSKCEKAGCAYLDLLDYNDPMIYCPVGHFGTWAKFSKLGDEIEAIAKPISKAFDKVAGTKISNCGGCKKMRERLNAGMTITEATKLRVIEFVGRKLGNHRKSILGKVDARLKANGK